MMSEALKEWCVCGHAKDEHTDTGGVTDITTGGCDHCACGKFEHGIGVADALGEATARIVVLERDLADAKHRLAYRTKELERAEEDVGYKEHTIEALEEESKRLRDALEKVAFRTGLCGECKEDDCSQCESPVQPVNALIYVRDIILAALEAS